jgi:hypothetical protein
MSDEWYERKKKKSWKDGLDQSFVDWFWGITFLLAWLVPVLIWCYLVFGRL